MQLADFLGFLGRFRADTRGMTAAIFALMFSAVLLMIAIAIDYSRMVTELSRDQRAVDAAVLAASERLGLDEAQAEGEALARAFYDVNRKPSSVSVLSDVRLDNETGEVSAVTATDWKATLLKAAEKWFPGVGADRTLSRSARVVRGTGTAEIALVLDNSGSMAGTYIEDLRRAANDLLGVVFAGVEGTDRVKVGVVPFAAAVNVGSAYQGASWIDSGGASSIHYENFSESRTRFQLFSDLNVGWAGCVEARPSGLDLTDAAPTGGDSLFVPMFAPDEPGEAGSTDLGYGNSYIADDGGSCTPYERTCLRYSRRGNCREWQVERLPNEEAQARTCKYANALITGGSGPNAMCTTQAVLPLNSTRASVEAAVQAMRAAGNTNIKEGVAWGWRVLSSREPFTEGRASGTEDNRKIMILMTDGENWYNHADNHNRSVYAAHGYAARGRLGNTYSRSAYTSHLNDRTRDVCANAKADGVTIYTVAFRLENDPTTQALLRDCASGPDYAFTAADGLALVQSFRNIGREITNVRVSG